MCFAIVSLQCRGSRARCQRPSPFWALPTTVGNATRAELTIGRITAKSEWLRNSKPSRLSFNAECMIAWPKTVHGSGRLCWVITNTTQSLGTRLSCASSNFACAGYGRVFWSAVASVPRCGGNDLPQSLNRWIPPPRVLHPYPDARFYATHPS
jgi:hypothetical protein